MVFGGCVNVSRLVCQVCQIRCAKNVHYFTLCKYFIIFICFSCFGTVCAYGFIWRLFLFFSYATQYVVVFVRLHLNILTLSLVYGMIVVFF